jgi:glycosyltransferase involved in cell wall biosynthesis
MNILSIITSEDLSSGGPIYLCNSQKKFLSKKCYIKIFSINNIGVVKFFLFFLGYKRKKILNILVKFSLVHFHEVWNIRHHLLAIILRRLSIPFIFSVHGHFDIWSLNKNYFLKKIFYFLFKKNFIYSSGLQISSIEELKQAKIFLNNANINFFLISNGVDININDIDFNKKRLDSNNIKLIFFGRIHYKKGIELLLYALKKILSDKKDQIINYSLTIVGPGEKYYIKQIKNLILDLKLTSVVKFLEPIYEERDKINLLTSYDIFLLPSYEEADSIALKEALACGLPVIISKQCRFNEVEIFNCGLILENNTSDDLFIAIKKMSDTKLLATMSKNSAQLIDKKYKSSLMNENFYEIYFDVMNGTRVAKNWACNNYRL